MSATIRFHQHFDFPQTETIVAKAVTGKGAAPLGVCPSSEERGPWVLLQWEYVTCDMGTDFASPTVQQSFLHSELWIARFELLDLLRGSC